MKVSVTLEVEVDEQWIEFCTKYNDLFLNDYIGYWGHGIRPTGRRDAWLVWEGEEDPRLADLLAKEGVSVLQQLSEESYKLLHDAARKAVKNGTPLPPYYHLLDAAAAGKAWVEGVKRKGLDWYENADSTDYDVVIQLALLGEIKYG